VSAFYADTGRGFDFPSPTPIPCMYKICNYKVFHVKRFVVTYFVHTLQAYLLWIATVALGEQWANKILFYIPTCTYTLCRNHKRSKSARSGAPSSFRSVTNCRSLTSFGMTSHGVGNYLPHRLFDLRDPVRALQYFAGLWAIGCAYYAIAFHQVDEMRGASIAYAQAAL
jgi:hypothetical protein